MDGALELIHATAIAVGNDAALIRGPSGSGKSDLALRCLALAPGTLIPAPAGLVSDDQVCLERVGERLRASAPPAIRGKLEVRGMGILSVPAVESAELVLVADLVSPSEIERLPDPIPSLNLLGVEVPLLRLAPFEQSAPVKLLLALSAARRHFPGA